MTDKNNWQVIHSLKQLNADLQKLIFSFSDNPFTSFEFLSALEESGCIGGQSGWLPHYYLYQNQQLNEGNQPQVGLFICYLKTHSYGEYVFDWAWADAYQRNGLNYYPKLLAGIPFSPIPCNKWLSNTNLDELTAFDQVKNLTLSTFNITGCHYIFPEQKLNLTANWIEREGHQFHWFNQDNNGESFTNFDHYLTLMTARKRKNINKERQRIGQSGISTYWRNGSEVTNDELTTFYQGYQSTYNKRGQKGYLNLLFFQQLCQTMPEQVHILFCKRDNSVIAAALYLCSKNTLYGRYWGAIEENDILHFEACYYQGIEFCIKHKINCFNPGTQGEHKISRGFVPTKTYSYHMLELEPFHQAIADFCQQEKQHNSDYMQACAARLPFKNKD